MLSAPSWPTAQARASAPMKMTRAIWVQSGDPARGAASLVSFGSFMAVLRASVGLRWRTCHAACRVYLPAGYGVSALAGADCILSVTTALRERAKRAQLHR